MKTKVVTMTLLCICASALFGHQCSRCRFQMADEDKFCQKCGANRYEKVVERGNSGQGHVLSHKSNASDISEYPFTGTMLFYMRKSDLITPLKLSLFDPVALPWDDSCTIYGMQLAVLGGSCHTLYGLNVCGIGSNLHTLGGISCGWFNMSHDVCGAQIGFFNTADRLKGLQIGIINFADSKNATGIQIGVFNTFKSGYNGDGWFFPGINICF